MNRRDDCTGPLFATDACEEVRSRAYGRLSKDLGNKQGRGSIYE